jgi:hypothetical protein
LASVVCSVWTVWTKFGQKTDNFFLKFVCASTKTGNSIQNARYLAQGIQDARPISGSGQVRTDRDRTDNGQKTDSSPKKLSICQPCGSKITTSFLNVLENFTSVLKDSIGSSSKRFEDVADFGERAADLSHIFEKTADLSHFLSHIFKFENNNTIPLDYHVARARFKAMNFPIPMHKDALLGDHPPSHFSEILTKYYGEMNKQLIVIPNTNSK